MLAGDVVRAGGSAQARGVVRVDGILWSRPPKTDLPGEPGLIYFVVLTVGLEAVSDDLEANGVADGNDVNVDSAVLVGFQLHRSRVFVALDGMKDDVSVHDRLAIVSFENGDLNARCGRRRLVFAAVPGVVVLRAEEDGTGDESKWDKTGAEAKNRTAEHGVHCKWWRGARRHAIP